MSKPDEEDIARAIVQLLEENKEVRSAVLSIIRSCPNVVMKF